MSVVPHLGLHIVVKSACKRALGMADVCDAHYQATHKLSRCVVAALQGR